MNKRRPELLDCKDEMVITDEVRDMFAPEEIKKLTMNKIRQEEIKELAMNKIHHSEKRPSYTRKFAAFFLAAALTAALAATAFAAYRFFVAEQFDDYFGALSEQQAKVMDRIGTGEMPPSTANGTTFTPLAAIGDDHHYYIKFRVEAPEGTQFPAASEELKALHIFGPTAEERYSIVDENGEKISISTSKTEWTNPAPNGHELECVIRFDSDMNAPAHFNDGKSKVLTIYGLWLEGTDKEYTKVLDGPWSFDIGFYGAAEEKTLDVDGLDVKCLANGVEREEEGVRMTLRSMRISPLTLAYTYDFTSPDPQRMIPGPGTVQIVMKDGSITEVMGGPGSSTGSSWSQQDTLRAPIDLDEVDYIQFGSQQIKMN